MGHYKPGQIPVGEAKELFELLTRCDKDFTPPLSQRAAVGQTDWDSQGANTGIKDYYESLIEKATIITVTRNNKLAGFCAYYYPYQWQGQSYLYVSTAVTAPEWRKHGLTNAYVRHICTAAMRLKCPILAKTWSTNKQSMTALSRYADRADTLCDDRGAGIDTIYWETTLDTLLYRAARRTLKKYAHMKSRPSLLPKGGKARPA